MTREELTTRLATLEERYQQARVACLQMEGAIALVRELRDAMPAPNGEDRTDALHD